MSSVQELPVELHNRMIFHFEQLMAKKKSATTPEKSPNIQDASFKKSPHTQKPHAHR